MSLKYINNIEYANEIEELYLTEGLTIINIV